MKWFKHDSDASMDAKLQDVLLEYGAEGYGLYWYCLELIAGSATSSNLTFELEHDARIIARNLGLGVQRVEEMMRHMIELGLFESSNGVITCLKMAKRADDFTRKALTTLSHKQSESQAPPDFKGSPTKTDKVLLEVEDRNRKEVEVRKEKKRRFAPPERHEIEAYLFEKTGIEKNPLAERFINHYESNGWMVGRNKMKSWKAAVNTWLSREGQSANIRPISNTTGAQRLTPAQQLRAEIAASRGGT